MTLRRNQIIKNVLLTPVILFFLFMALYPYVWNLSMSFKPANEILRSNLIPALPTLANYADFFGRTGVVEALRNSIVVSVLSAVLASFVGLFAAYALVRFKVRGGRTILQTILGAQFIPIVAIIIPLYVLIAKLGLIDSWAGLILVYLAVTVPFTTWMLLGFVEKVPIEIEEAALLDGCSRFGAVVRVVLPLSLPAFFVTLVFSFIKVWEEYVAAVVLTETLAARTLPVLLAGLQSQVSFTLGTMTAGLVVAGAPPILAFLFLHRYFLRGLGDT